MSNIAYEWSEPIQNIPCCFCNSDKPSNFQEPGSWLSDVEKRSILHAICRKYLEESVFSTNEVVELADQVERLNTTSKEGYACRECGHFIQEEWGKVQGNGSLFLQCQSCIKHIDAEW